jgi:5-methylcytosine-specific restriction endonuclease McrA
MTRYWICHWQNRTWCDEVNGPEYKAVRGSLSNSFRRRCVSVGDVAYVVSLIDGQLFLGGRMTVSRIISRDEAVRTSGNDNLYPAEECIIDEKGGSPLNFHRRLAPTLSRQLRFLSPQGQVKGLCFVSDTHLDTQATRGIRELTPESAVLLDRIIEVTDALPRSDEVITVSEGMLLDNHIGDAQKSFKLPEEVPIGSTFGEGSVERILVNRYERDRRARDECIKHYGTSCFLCGFDFSAAYGEAMAGFIHVHHLSPLSSVGKGYQVDAVQDLRPVCPNCHATLHSREPAYSLEEVCRLLESQRRRMNAEGA